MRSSPGLGGGMMLRAMGRAVGGVKGNVASGGGGVKGNVASGGGGGEKGSKPQARSASAGMAPPSPPPLSASASRGSFSCPVDGDEWETVGKDELELEEFGEDICGGITERFVFGPSPTKEEAEDAVSTMQQIFVPVTFSQGTEDTYPSPSNTVALDGVITSTDMIQTVSPDESESDWIEPALHIYSSRNYQSRDHGKVLDAFRLLQINPSVQRMVVALSSDKAVWDAVMRNEVVQEFKNSVNEVENGEPHGSDKGPLNILKWILDSTKEKLMEFFDNITKLVNEMFRSQEKDKETDLFDDVLRSSFMLSVVVFVIVVATRVQKA